MSDKATKLLSRFYVKLPSSSKKTKTVGAEVPIDYDRWLAEVAASSEYPEYKTKSDIIRDGIHLVLTLRTDPEFRDVPELQSMRQGILALQGLDALNNLRAQADELATSLYMVTPGTKAADSILAQARDFHAGLEDPQLQARLGSAIQSFSNR